MLEIADKVIAGLKAAREAAKRMHDADLQSQIADLMVDASELKLQLASLREENAALKRKGDLRAKMSVQKNVLYLTEKIPGYNEGPFCPICFEKDGILINVWKGAYGAWHCPHCEKTP